MSPKTEKLGAKGIKEVERVKECERGDLNPYILADTRT